MTELIYEAREVILVKVRIPDEALRRQQKLLGECKCIGCEGPAGENVRRGLCPACYQAAHRAMVAKRITDQQLVREGKMLPAKTAGRRTTNKFTIELSGR